MVCLQWSSSIFHIPTFCRFVFLMFHNQLTWGKQGAGRSGEQKRPIVEMNEIELIQPTNRAIERKYMYNMMKKGRFCFETHQKIRILYVVLRYVMYVDKLLFWH